MGHVNTQITLKNIYDIKQAKEGTLPEKKIRQATIDVMVDTGATMLVINEQLFQQLGLGVMGEREISLANWGCRRWHISHPSLCKSLAVFTAP
jgi:predicted aspartyl protease